jgi:hypothetical protein
VTVGALALAAAAFAAAAPLAATTSARSRPRPIVSLSASPATLAVTPDKTRKVNLTNFGSSRLVVRITTSGLSVDLRGRPRLEAHPAAGRNAARWLRIRPRTVVIPARARRVVSVGVRMPRRAQPGDHHAALVFATRPLDRLRVGVRVRVAVRIGVRAPGLVRRRLTIAWLRVRRAGRGRRLELRLSNRGNITEELTGRIGIVLATSPRTVLRLGGRREVLPARDAIVTADYRGRYRGAVTALVTVRASATRRFRVRL